MNKTRVKNWFFPNLLPPLLLAGCASIHVEQNELANMDASQVIHRLAKDRPIQVAWRQRVIDSIQRIDTANFTAYQTHYVTTSVDKEGKDFIAARFVKSYCEAKDGIYPDKTFGAANPHGFRIDCMSLATGKLLFSIFTSKSSKFPLVMGSDVHYNLIAIAVPKEQRDVDPATEYRMGMRELPHNYFPRGAINMFALGRQ